MPSPSQVVVPSGAPDFETAWSNWMSWSATARYDLMFPEMTKKHKIELSIQPKLEELSVAAAEARKAGTPEGDARAEELENEARGVSGDPKDFDIIFDLMNLDVLPEYNSMIEEERGIYGWIPLIGESKIGSNLSSGFSERVNSAAKFIMGVDRTSLEKHELGATVFCRMNPVFIEHMEANYPTEVAKFAEVQLQRALNPALDLRAAPAPSRL